MDANPTTHTKKRLWLQDSNPGGNVHVIKVYLDGQSVYVTEGTIEDEWGGVTLDYRDEFLSLTENEIDVDVKKIPLGSVEVEFCSSVNVNFTRAVVTNAIDSPAFRAPYIPYISFDITFDIINWDRSWNFRMFRDAMMKIAEQKRFAGLTILQSFASNVSVCFNLHSSQTLYQALDEYSKVVQLFFNDVGKYLSGKSLDDSLYIRFLFPEDIRIFCEQYLIYFGQFLKDLGVEAIVEIEHTPEARDIVLKVTPTAGYNSLKNVRKALDDYLGMAQVPQNSLGFHENPIFQRLQSQILYFQSQLILAQAIIQQKDATIEMKSEMITFLQSQRIFAESEVKNKKDRLNLPGGVGAVTVYEGKGFEINIPHIMRSLKRLLIEEDSVSERDRSA